MTHRVASNDIKCDEVSQNITQSYQVLYRQAVSEALFDNCEDYQNIQNSSCKVESFSSMDIIVTIVAVIVIHQHHLSTYPPINITYPTAPRVSRCGVLTDLSN